MAGAAPGYGQGTKATFDLNRAASAFSTSLIKDKVQKLSADYDEDLEKTCVPQIRKILEEVDQKCVKFNDAKQHLILNLEATLTSLQLEDEAIQSAINEIDELKPTWLSLMPKADTLAIRPATPTDSQSVLSNSTRSSLSALSSTGSVNTDSTGVTTAASSDKAFPAQAGEPARSGKATSTPARGPADRDVAANNAKRLLENGSEETETSRKKPKINDFKGRGTIKMAELDATECVFKHTGQHGFHVIRCEFLDCTMRIFSALPFKNNTAFNHFNVKHFQQCKTESYIFENFSYRVEDATEEKVAARYLHGSISECTPATKLPEMKVVKLESPKTARKADTTKKDDSSERIKPVQPAENEIHSHDDDYSDRKDELEYDAPHRNLRQKPKTSYADLIRGRGSRMSMPAPEREPLTTNTSFQQRRSVDRASRQSSTTKGKAGKSSTATTGKPLATELSKSGPFGHVGAWPRRHAPR